MTATAAKEGALERSKIGEHPVVRVILKRTNASTMKDFKDKIKRGLEELEQTAKRAGEAAVEAATAVGKDAKATWEEQVRPGLEPIERDTKAHAKKIGDEIIDAVSAARERLLGRPDESDDD